jgi:hypothetical protein
METPRNDTHPEDTARPDATEGKWAVPAAVEAREPRWRQARRSPAAGCRR